jgi:hypothetical protein
MMWSLLGTLLGFLLAAAILIAWLFVKHAVRALFRLTRAGLLGVRHLWKSLPARSDRPTAPGVAPVYSLDDYRALRAATGHRGGRDRG